MKSIYKAIASGAGSGYAPFAPGTVGSAVACGFIAALHAAAGSDTYLYQGLLILLLLLLIFAGMHAIHRLEGEWPHDAPRITVDEMAGMTLAMVAVPYSWHTLLGAFVLFRFFDILKPFGIRSLERLPNAWGVMLDDLLAGVFANIVMQVILLAVLNT